MDWMRKAIWWLRRCGGFHDCPLCKAQAVRMHCDNPIHPDGPPMFQWWSCGACGARTDVQASWLFQDVANNMGIDLSEHPLFKPVIGTTTPKDRSDE
jgi:hypothetical protein